MKIPITLKHIFCTACLIICISFMGNAQKQLSLSEEVTHLYENLNQKYGNLYFLDEYNFKPSSKDSMLLAQTEHTTPMIKQNKMSRVALDFETIKKRIIPQKIVDIARYSRLKNKTTSFSNQEREYGTKLDDFNDTYTNSRNDSLKIIRPLLDYSTKNSNVGERITRNRKKLFQVLTTYQSEKFYLIIYKINFGNIEDHIFAELILR